MKLKLNIAVGNLPVGTILDVTDVTPKMLFDKTSFWNTQLINPFISPKSKEFVTEFTRNWNLAGPWINTNRYSTPLYIVDGSTPRVPVTIIKAGIPLTTTNLYKECEKGVPIPVGTIPAAGTDGTCTIWDKQNDIIYEFWQLKSVPTAKNPTGWQATWGAIIHGVSYNEGIIATVKNSAGGLEYQGATATSLPAIAGTMLLEELSSGIIQHALAFAIVEPIRVVFKWPALRTDGWGINPLCMAEGQRFTFPKDISINPNWCPMIKMMVTAIRDYGMVLRDRAGSVVFFGEDPTQYKLPTDPYKQYYGGKELWDVMKQFPIDSLQALV